MYSEIRKEVVVGSQGNADDYLLVALSYCEHCHEAIAFLKEQDRSFSYLFLDTLPHSQRGELLRDLKRRTQGELVFPVLLGEDALLSGFQRDVWSKTVSTAAG